MIDIRQIIAAATCSLLLAVTPSQSQVPVDGAQKITDVDLFVAPQNSQVVVQTEYTDRAGPGLHVWYSAGFYDPVVVNAGQSGWYGFSLFPETQYQLQRFVTRVWSFNYSRVNTTIVVN
jgi:hypothetical protein